ncbi:unnamed protein product [Dibothriocephalus latus]|uniref:Uncharacterized protein n=1 Tax=Dibothriocephalus latus TaxID=60516 RepID=A0A3P7LC17_DIBLA|nr:unnamed protein product [Dibothriocephalus latus]
MSPHYGRAYTATLAVIEKSSSCVDRLRNAMRKLQVTPIRASPANTFIPLYLETCKFVVVWRNAVLRPLQTPYCGPYKAVRRSDKEFIMDRNGKSDTVSSDRVKTAYVEDTEPTSTAHSL